MEGPINGDRFQRREGDGVVVTVIQWLMAQAKLRLALVVASLFSVLGAGIALLFMRAIVLDKVLAQDVSHGARFTSVDERIGKLEAKVGNNTVTLQSLTTSAGTLLRAECLRNSKATQELLQMTCPSNLYRGAPR